MAKATPSTPLDRWENAIVHLFYPRSTLVSLLIFASMLLIGAPVWIAVIIAALFHFAHSARLEPRMIEVFVLLFFIGSSLWAIDLLRVQKWAKLVDAHVEASLARAAKTGNPQ